MDWVYFLLLLLVDVGGLVLAAFTLPGLWLMLGAAAVYAWVTGGEYIGWKSLIAMFVLSVGSEIAELTLGGAGAKKAGATKWGVFGGLIGAVIGGIFFTGLLPIPVLGTVVGICLGSFAGASVIELVMGAEVTRSVKIGIGAAKGRLMGIIAKVAIGVLIILITLVVGFPVGGTRRQRAVSVPTPTTRIATAVPTTRG